MAHVCRAPGDGKDPVSSPASETALGARVSFELKVHPSGTGNVLQLRVSEGVAWVPSCPWVCF